MTRPLFATIAAVALAAPFSVSTAMATTIIVDDFTVGQQAAVATSGPTSTWTCGGGASILGGCRYLEVSTDQGFSLGTILSVENGLLTFDNGSASTGTGWIVYDGNGDRSGATAIADVNGVDFGSSVYTNGLGGEDLLMGQETGFFTITPAEFDQTEGTVLEFSAFAWDMFGGAVSYFEDVDLTSFSPILGYDQFSGTDGFRWDQLGALAFRVDSVNVAFDGQITSITATPIPLPAAAFLLLGGLGGLAGVSFAGKRRRKS
jgi:hypothetical protein